MKIIMPTAISIQGLARVASGSNLSALPGCESSTKAATASSMAVPVDLPGAVGEPERDGFDVAQHSITFTASPPCDVSL